MGTPHSTMRSLVIPLPRLDAPSWFETHTNPMKRTSRGTVPTLTLLNIPSWILPMRFRINLLCGLMVVLLLLPSCGDSTGSDGFLSFEIRPAVLELGEVRDTTLHVVNTGTGALGPVQLSFNEIRNSDGVPTPELDVTLSPGVIATLGPGDSLPVALSLSVPDGTPDDRYSFVLNARVTGTPLSASMEARFRVVDPRVATVASVVITSDSLGTIRQGDVNHLTTEVRDSAGAVVQGIGINWAVLPVNRGFVTRDGKFVGYGPGGARITARVGSAADTVDVTVTSRDVSGTLSIVGRGIVLDRFTSDLWVHGTTAYTGTWGQREDPGNTLHTWDIGDPTNPVLTSTITVDARTVNDVKISSDGTLGVITHEGSNDSRNGVTLLDLSDPLTPSVISRTTASLVTGVHNAWIDGSYVYLAVDGSAPTSGLRVLDVSDPANPQIAASFYAGSSFLHDVYVRDGLAFLSHWDAGLIILDVGNGMSGGSPESPVEVGRVKMEGGNTHNAWYWPDGGYVFVGEENFSRPGVMHVVDVRDLRNPTEVATYSVAGQTPHNFWMDEDRAILYLAWYDKGLRVLDVSGELLGDLGRQGREIAGFPYAEAARSPLASRTWAPQLHAGLIFLSDLNTGLWVLRPEF